jgi:hypothetical protein
MVCSFFEHEDHFDDYARSGDVFAPESWRSALKGAGGVVASIGGFGSYEEMRRINGDSNLVVAEVPTFTDPTASSILVLTDRCVFTRLPVPTPPVPIR